jgi:hypothetical protein
MAITPEQARAELERRRAARAGGQQAAGSASVITPEMARAELERRRAAKQASPAQPAGADQPGYIESLGRGGLQGATLGHGEEIQAAASALGISPTDALRMAGAGPIGGAAIAGGRALQALYSKGPSGIVDDYRRERDEARAKNEAAKQANPKTYMAGQIGGGVATALVPGAAPATIGKAAVAGAGIGALAGVGGTDADLTRGEIKDVAKDAAVGGATGGAFGAAAKPIATAVGGVLGAVSKNLQNLGQARLFKAAVGQNKRAFVQVDGKGLMEKAGQYLDDLGVGLGDSTEGIAKKLTTRVDTLRTSLDDTVSALDAASGGKITVSPQAIADRIEKEVAEPMKKIVASRKDYAEIMDEVQAIRGVDRPISFAEAAEQRAGVQKQINYDSFNKRDVVAGARRQIARIWNDEIDKQAEGLLKSAGKKGDAYKELRHEFALAQELLGHVANRVQGNAANRVMSPSDYGMGGIAGIMTGNPFLGAVAAISNHLGRVYGNAAAGRAAINISRVAASGKRGTEAVLPAALRGARAVPPVSSGAQQARMLPTGVVAVNENDRNGR